MRLREEPAVEERAAEPASLAACIVASEQLLGHGVAIVVGEHPPRREAERLHHALDQVRLLVDRIGAPTGLVGEPEAEQVRSHAAEAFAQRRPGRDEVVARRREAVEQEQDRLLRARRVGVGHEDAPSVDLDGGPGPAPGPGQHARVGHRRAIPRAPTGADHHYSKASGIGSGSAKKIPLSRPHIVRTIFERSSGMRQAGPMNVSRSQPRVREFDWKKGVRKRVAHW